MIVVDHVAVLPVAWPRKPQPLDEPILGWGHTPARFELIPVVWTVVEEPADGWLPKDPAPPPQTAVV